MQTRKYSLRFLLINKKKQSSQRKKNLIPSIHRSSIHILITKKLEINFGSQAKQCPKTVYYYPCARDTPMRLCPVISLILHTIKPIDVK